MTALTWGTMRISSVSWLVPFAFLLAGCGGGGGTITAVTSDDSVPETTEGDGSGGTSGDDAVALRASLLTTGLGIDEESAQCATDAMIGKISAEGLKMMLTSDGAMSDLGADDQEIVRSALNECIEFSAFGDSMVAGFTGEDSLFTLSDAERECAVAALEVEFGGFGDAIFLIDELSSDEGTAKILDSVGGCVSKESLVPALTTLFGEEGVDEATGACVAEALVTRFGGTELFRAFTEAAAGSPPADFEAAVTEATVACAGVGGAGVGTDSGGTTAVGGGIGN